MLPLKTIKHLKKLDQKKYRNQFGEFMVEGIKGVTEALESEAEVVLIIIEGSKRDETEFAEIIKKTEGADVQIEFAGRNEVDKIKTTEKFPGVMAVIEVEDFELEDLINDSTIICLDRINDPGNLGTIIRTADWFGIKNILLSEGSADVYNSKTVRATMGSIFHVNIFASKDLEKSLKNLKKEEGYKAYAMVMDGSDLNKAKLSQKKTIYILGSESHGVDPKLEKLAEKSYTIPGSGQAESLNVAMAAGILMSKLEL